MTKPTTTSGQPGNEEVIDLDEHAEGRGQGDGDDDAAEDDPEVLAGMMAGFKAVTGNTDLPDTLKDVPTTEGKKRFGGGSDTGDEEEEDDDGAQGNQPQAKADDAGADEEAARLAAEAEAADNRVVFGGMTAKQLREKLDKTDSLEKTTATLAGRVGYLQQQMQSSGKPRALTKDDFPSLREEFGDEYAEAVARDLSKVVTGGASSQDDIDSAVNAKVQQIAQQTERKLVRMAHPDAPDYFAGGKKHEAFMGWVQQLPEERRNVLLNSWDSDDIIPALNDFKNSTEKAAREAAARGSRINRAVSNATGATTDAPAGLNIDPLEHGWRLARGQKPMKGQMRAPRH